MFDCVTYGWSPGIGDPTVFGWATVALYIIAAAMCYRRARDGFSGLYPHIADLRRFWAALFALLVLMAINKQLDAQSLLTVVGRCAAREQGWYNDRSTAQYAFVLGLALVLSLGAGVVIWKMRQVLRRIWLVVVGLVMLIFFVLYSATSFHHLDIFINRELLGLKMIWVVEMGALVLIIIGARRTSMDKGPNMRRGAPPQTNA